MYATIQRWGNSQGLRIPKALLDALELRENDRVELVQTSDGIHIRKAVPIHRTLEERPMSLSQAQKVTTPRKSRDRRLVSGL